MSETTMPNWVLTEAAKRSGWEGELMLRHRLVQFPVFRALCDMILKHEQPPVDRKVLCAREAMSCRIILSDTPVVEAACVRAIDLYLEGFGR